MKEDIKHIKMITNISVIADFSNRTNISDVDLFILIDGNMGISIIKNIYEIFIYIYRRSNKLYLHGPVVEFKRSKSICNTLLLSNILENGRLVDGNVKVFNEYILNQINNNLNIRKESHVVIRENLYYQRLSLFSNPDYSKYNDMIHVFKHYTMTILKYCYFLENNKTGDWNAIISHINISISIIKDYNSFIEYISDITGRINIHMFCMNQFKNILNHASKNSIS